MLKPERALPRRILILSYPCWVPIDTPNQRMQRVWNNHPFADRDMV